jgi:hypothetical protein
MPAKLQIPNSKSQIPNPNVKSQLLENCVHCFVWILGLRIGIWNLGFGIWDLLMRRLDVNDDVNDLRKLLH